MMQEANMTTELNIIDLHALQITKDELSIVEKIKNEKTENMSKGLFRIHLPFFFFSRN